jgi:hypothetical protein
LKRRDQLRLIDFIVMGLRLRNPGGEQCFRTI